MRRVSSHILLRVVGGVGVLWAAATVVFFSLRLIPGDPAEALLGGPGSQASQAALDQVRETYGLNDPLPVQYLHHLVRLVSGDLGMSYSLKRPVVTVLSDQLGPTLILSLAALACAWLLAIPLALIATGRKRVSRSVAGATELTAAALPHFWLASILIAVFSTSLRWLPPISTGDLRGLVLPTLTLAIPVAGFLSEVMRDTLMDALSSPFALSARARGSGPTRIVLVHALRHAAIPGINLTAWAFGYLISGAVVVETIFARPGLGRTLLSAVTSRDVPLVTGVVLVSAAAYVAVMIGADLLMLVADPRTRKHS